MPSSRWSVPSLIDLWSPLIERQLARLTCERDPRSSRQTPGKRSSLISAYSSIYDYNNILPSNMISIFFNLRLSAYSSILNDQHIRSSKLISIFILQSKMISIFFNLSWSAHSSIIRLSAYSSIKDCWSAYSSIQVDQPIQTDLFQENLLLLLREALLGVGGGGEAGWGEYKLWCLRLCVVAITIQICFSFVSEIIHPGQW